MLNENERKVAELRPPPPADPNPKGFGGLPAVISITSTPFDFYGLEPPTAAAYQAQLNGVSFQVEVRDSAGGAASTLASIKVHLTATQTAIDLDSNLAVLENDLVKRMQVTDTSQQVLSTAAPTGHAKQLRLPIRLALLGQGDLTVWFQVLSQDTPVWTHQTVTIGQ